MEQKWLNTYHILYRIMYSEVINIVQKMADGNYTYTRTCIHAHSCQLRWQIGPDHRE